jgi:hypothetical protein
MAGCNRLGGRFCKKSSVTRINNLPWKKKREEVDVEVVDSYNLIEEGRRLVDFKYLASQFRCHQCSSDLSPLHTISEFRVGVASTFVVKCQSCQYENNIYSSTWTASNKNRRLFDVNSKLALGKYVLRYHAC